MSNDTTAMWCCECLWESAYKVDPSTWLLRQPVLPLTSKQTSQQGSACPHDPSSAFSSHSSVNHRQFLHRLSFLLPLTPGPPSQTTTAWPYEFFTTLSLDFITTLSNNFTHDPHTHKPELFLLNYRIRWSIPGQNLYSLQWEFSNFKRFFM